MDYTYFTFDGISSKKYNIIVENNGEDLSFPSQPDFENNIVSPMFQDTSYLMGVNKKERTFNLKCWIDSADRGTINNIIDWLSVDKEGFLILDYNPNFKYRVKVSSISDFLHFIPSDGLIQTNYTESATLTATNKITLKYEPISIISVINLTQSIEYENIEDYIYQNGVITILNVNTAVDDNIRILYVADGGFKSINYGFTISFVTVGDFAAISRNDYRVFRDGQTAYVLELDGLLPIGFYDEVSEEVKLFNFHDLPTWLQMEMENVQAFTISKNNENYYTYQDLDSIGTIEINSRFGTVKTSDKLVEEFIDTSTQNAGPMLIEPGQAKVTITKIGRES